MAASFTQRKNPVGPGRYLLVRRDSMSMYVRIRDLKSYTVFHRYSENINFMLQRRFHVLSLVANHGFRIQLPVYVLGSRRLPHLPRIRNLGARRRGLCRLAACRGINNPSQRPPWRPCGGRGRLHGRPEPYPTSCSRAGSPFRHHAMISVCGGCGHCRKHSPTVNVVAIPLRAPRSGRNRSLDLMGGRGRRVAASLRR